VDKLTPSYKLLDVPLRAKPTNERQVHYRSESWPFRVWSGGDRVADSLVRVLYLTDLVTPASSSQSHARFDIVENEKATGI
jgi:hypothetical protein